MSAAALSVVIPTYNRAGVVGRAVDSILRPEVGDVEVLIVDDGSVDDTSEIVASRSDPRLRYLAIAHAGVSAARNAGARAARGPWLAFLDSDDEALPGWLDALAGMLGQGADIALCGGEAVDRDGTLLWRWGPSADPLNMAATIAEKFLPGHFAVRKDRFLAIGGYVGSLSFGENTELALRLLFSDPAPTVAADHRPLVRRHVDRSADSYGRARPDSARYVLAHHPDLRWRLPSLWASYQAIVGVDAARGGDLSKARRHFREGIVEPKSVGRASARLLISLVPPLARMVWRPLPDPAPTTPPSRA